MKKTKVTLNEALRYFAQKKGVEQPQAEYVNKIIVGDGSALEGDYLVNIHGCGLGDETTVTDDGSDNQFTPDSNGDMYEQRVSFSTIEAYYTKGAVVIEGFRYTGNGSN